jgi:hypothetical protein
LLSGILRSMPVLRPAPVTPRRTAALLATFALGLTTTPQPVAAASGGLVVLARTSYAVAPSEHRVHVTVEAVATSFEPDTSAGQTYYTGVNFAVQPGASNVVALSAGQAIGATVVRREEDFSVIGVTFGRGVFYQQSYADTVSFDLLDAGGRGTRDLRIGSSLAAFPVWAFGTDKEPGSSVTVDLPNGYTPDVQGSEMSSRSLPDGGTQLSAAPDDPATFFAYVTADRPGAFDNQSTRVDVNGLETAVLVRSWDDDPAWGRRITTFMRRGLPVLQRLIGFDYPGREPRMLTVEEAATSRLGEYAGIYNPDISLIRIRYDADAVVTLHEAAHIWFNGTLFKDRWIGESWAEFYGARAAANLGAQGATPVLTDELLDAKIPLNDWGAIGVESLEVEDFAYAATYEVARQIAGRTDLADLRLVWGAADADQEAYLPLHHQPSAASHVAFDVAGWQRLLDLLEERTETGYADVWRRWIVNDEQLPLLARRESARGRYDEVVAAAGEWELPAAVRHEMGLWQFDQAEQALGTAEDVLGQRQLIERAARRLDLDPPATLQQAFEGDEGLDHAAAEAGAELDAISHLERAAGHLDAGSGVLVGIGLLGTDPNAQLDSARTHFEDGDLEAAGREATDLVNAVDGAEGAGRLRVAAAGGGILLLDGLCLAALGRRRRRAVTVSAA